MSLKSHEARKLAVAGLAAFAAFGAAASPALAVQTHTLTYKCKYPLIGTNPLSIKINLDIPDTVVSGVTTPAFGITAVATASGNTVPGLALVEGLTSIEGVSTATSSINIPGSPAVNVKVPITIPKYVLPQPVPDPLVLNAAGSTPPLTIDAEGVATIKLDKLALNLRANDPDGLPIVLPPVTKDIDGNVVKDSDGLDSTFDVYCKLDAGQDITLGTFTVLPDGDTVAPTNPTVTATPDVTSVALSWSGATDNVGVTGYDVYNGATLVSSVTGTTATVSGLTASTPYTFKVVAKDAAGNKSSGGTVSATTKPPVVGPDVTPPTAPGEGVLSAADFTPTSINLRWTASTDEPGGSGLKEYVIRYEDQEIRVPAGTLTKKLTGLGADSEYFITISAVDNAGNESDPLELFYVTPLNGNVAPTKPGTPTLGAATTETSLAVSWTAATDDVAVVNYDVFNGATKVATVTGTSATITGLAPNTAYSIKVVANDGGAPVLSTSSDVASLKTKADTTAPSNPTVTATPALTSVALSWSGATDNIGVTGYDVYNGATLVSSVTGTTATVTGLASATSYTFKIVAKDAAGNKSSGGTVTSKTLTPGDTTAPTNPTVTATPAATSVALAWSGATDAVGVTGYDVYNGATLVTSTATTSTTVTGLTAGTSYTFKVVAKDAAGNKSSGGTVTTTTTGGGTTPSVNYSYTLKGSTTLKTLTKGNLPLSGLINANLILATGQFTADLTLNDTQGQLTALGFLPVTAKIGFVPSGKTTGSLLDGVLKTSSLVRIKVKEVKLFGAIPLAGGNTCQTKSLSKIDLKSTQAEFSPLVGGPIAGTYSISDLNGCGALNGLVSPLTAGGGNTINLNLTPKK